MQNIDVRVTDINGAEQFLASQSVQYVPPSIAPALLAHPICSKSLDDVLQHIRASEVHRQGIRGKGVHIAIVDTGICGTRKEFPAGKQSPLSFTIGPNRQPAAQDNSWFAGGNHASMTACIAAATKGAGGIYDGVAPDATLISCRVPDVDETYLIPAYERLIHYVKQGKVRRLVINNSYGPRGTDPQSITAFIDIV